MSERSGPVTILMAEDDADDRYLAQLAMEEGHLLNRLHCVTDGVELLEYLGHRGRYTDASAYPLPAIILLDLNMPRMDGREALQKLKADARLRHIPVVVLTTSKADEDIVRSYDLGASSFITKPVTFDSLVEVMKTMRRYWFEIVALSPDREAAQASYRDAHPTSS